MLNFDLLKLSNILSGQSPTTPNQGVMSNGPSLGPQNDMPDLMGMIRELLNPQDAQFKRYEDMMNQMPQRADYQPSKWRQIAAAVAGMGTGNAQGIVGGQPIGFKADIPSGLKVQQAIKDEPYNRALSDWKTNTEPILDLAKMENTRNINDRATGLGVLQRQTAQEAQDERERSNRIKEEQNEKKIEIQQQRANVYEYKAKNPNLVIKENADGNLIGIDPSDGSSDLILDANGNPVKSSVLTDAERIKLKEESDKRLISARGSEQRKTNAANAANRTNDDWDVYTNEAGETIRMNRSTGEVQKTDIGKVNRVSGVGASAKPDSPSQQKIAMSNKANQVTLQHPEWSKWIKITKEGISITPPSSGGFFSSGPDKATYDAIISELGLKKGTNPLPDSPPNQTQSRELIRKGSEVGDPLRSKAVEILKSQNKPLTAANIEYVMKQLEKK